MKFGNQQERLIGWLAGMIDADGSIGLHQQKFDEQITYVPSISLTTSCDATRKFLVELFSALDVGCHVTERQPQNRNWSKVWVFNMRGMKRAAKFLPMIRDCLVTKQKECDLVLEFIASRQSRPKASPYSEADLSFVGKIKACKDRNRSLSSEAICQAPNVI